MISFSLGGCRFSLGFSCFALLAFCCLFLGAGGSAFFLLAVLFHEGAHIVVMAHFGAMPAAVQLTALGCRMVPRRDKLLPYGEQALVSLAGPGCNLLCAGGMGCFFQGGDHPFFWSSLVLGILHSLPVEPLDGGMAFRCFLSSRMAERTASRISLWVSLLILFPLAVLGFLLLLRTRYNFTLLALSMYLMLYLVLKRDLFTG